MRRKATGIRALGLVAGAAGLMLGAVPAAATSVLPDTIVEFTREASLEGAGIDIAPGYRVTETPESRFLIPVSSIAGGDVAHFATTIQLLTDTTRVAIEDWFFDTSEWVITGDVVWHDGFGSDRVDRFLDTIPLFEVALFDEEKDLYLLELQPELAAVFHEAFGDDGTLFPAGYRFAFAKFPALGLEPVPEPALGLVLAAGLGALALRRRRP